MKNLVCASTPTSQAGSAAGSGTLPPLLVERAATRLRWLALLCAILTIVSILLQRWLQPEMAAAFKGPVLPLIALTLVLVSFGLSALQHFHLLAPVTMLRLGMGFEVLVAFVIAFAETSFPLASDRVVVGTSGIAAWIAVVSLLIPNRPVMILITGLLSASMWPFAHWLHVSFDGNPPLALNRIAVWVYMPYLMALVSFGIAKRIYLMEVAVQKAQDLGSYKLVSLIGKGGMGEVWRASHRMLARDAAVKLIRPDLVAMQSGRQANITRRRFEREAGAIASLQSPHTVYLFDFGVSQDGTFYYVMELLDGISLEVLVSKYGPQPASRVAHILEQVCQSLEEAHRRGLVHRDIKPSNIFICRLGLETDFVKVLDFGLVKEVSSEETMHLTMDGTAAGTPAYMAPEVALGERALDGRVDLYGLGCVAYLLLTGSTVFNENTPTATALAHVQKQPVPPSQRSEMPVPRDLEGAILSCLAKKPEDRPATAAELGRRLAACKDLPQWTPQQACDWWEAYLPASNHPTLCHPHVIDDLAPTEG